jgi:ABC-type bacteriocin/lantibiotic exporter with double-glycine peptidase domain
MRGFFAHLLSLPYRFFEQRGSGDLLMRLWSNATLRETLTSQTLSVVLDGSLVLGYLAFLLRRDVVFGTTVLAIGLLQVGVVLGARSRTRELTQRDLLAQAASESYLVEALTGVATLKASGAEEHALAHWSDLYATELDVSVRRDQLAAVVDTALTALRVFAPLALLWLGAVRVLDGTLSLGTMLALQAVAAAVLTPLASLVATGQRLQLVGAHLDRLGDVLEAEPEQPVDTVAPSPPLTGRIELDRLGFRYDPRAPWVLRDISLVIEPGQKIALVGRSGSGKSTLGKLLLGLYPPTEGDVRYDGRSLRSVNLHSLRRQVGVVLQEPFLLSGSIRQNIAFNDPGLSVERVREAARLAGIADEIERMPMGYETRLAEGGAGLSGGQRQRLVLARAFAQRPAVLLLDEATSHLDVVSEALVDRNLEHLACTRIVIAHRLSTVRDADRIVVLDAGRIVEQGTHEALLAQEGAYAALVRHQSPSVMTDGGMGTSLESAPGATATSGRTREKMPHAGNGSSSAPAYVSPM